MKKIITIFLYIKGLLGCKTFHLENAFVLFCLSLIAIWSQKGFTEWVAVFAVFASFNHASVANRLSEKEEERAKNEAVFVECYEYDRLWFYSKEFLWVCVFAINLNYSALAGCVIFFIYPTWRKIYRKYCPLRHNPVASTEKTLHEEDLHCAWIAGAKNIVFKQATHSFKEWYSENYPQNNNNK